MTKDNYVDEPKDGIYYLQQDLGKLEKKIESMESMKLNGQDQEIIALLYFAKKTELYSKYLGLSYIPQSNKHIKEYNKK